MSTTAPTRTRIVYGMAPIFCLSRSIHKVKAVSSNLNLALLCTTLRDDDEHSPTSSKKKKSCNKASSSILKMILPILNMKKKKRASKENANMVDGKMKRHRATTSVGSSNTMATFISSVGGEDTDTTIHDDRGGIESFTLLPYEVSGSKQLSPKKVKIISPPSLANDQQQQQVDVEDMLLPSSTSSTSMRRTVSVISNLKDIEFLQQAEKKVASDEDDYGWFVQDDKFSLYHHYYE